MGDKKSHSKLYTSLSPTQTFHYLIIIHIIKANVNCYSEEASMILTQASTNSAFFFFFFHYYY